jgi:hypothetical protein
VDQNRSYDSPAALLQIRAATAAAMSSEALPASSLRNRSSGRTTRRGTALCDRSHGLSEFGGAWIDGFFEDRIIGPGVWPNPER